MNKEALPRRQGVNRPKIMDSMNSIVTISSGKQLHTDSQVKGQSSGKHGLAESV